MQGVRGQVPTASPSELFALWQARVLERAWETICGEAMGWETHGTNMRLVREGVCLYEAETADVRQGLWEQISMGEATAERVSRLRMLGNGVVPLQAAYAFVSLWAALTDGGQVR